MKSIIYKVFCGLQCLVLVFTTLFLRKAYILLISDVAGFAHIFHVTSQMCTSINYSGFNGFTLAYMGANGQAHLAGQ